MAKLYSPLLDETELDHLLTVLILTKSLYELSSSQEEPTSVYSTVVNLITKLEQLK